MAIGAVAVATFGLYYWFSQNLVAAIVLTVVMVIIGFLFAAVAGYLVALIGSSNNPISGLTLSALIIAAVLMVFLGVTDIHGVAAVLGVAGVVCCAAGIAGDMMQDLKVGLVMTFPLMALHRVYTIGSADLPAPQAGLMALMAEGIVAGNMAWPLVIAGMFLALGLILIKAPAPMLVAVGMYLPFQSTAAIFVGGLIRWLLDLRLKRTKATEEVRSRAENTGILLSSGFIAGESLMAVILALMVIGGDVAPWLLGFQSLTGSAGPSFWLSLLIYPVIIYLLVWMTVAKGRQGGVASTKVGE
jgi:uncharacterized oligopeptide transporter (OPT) family protein